jgi:hypothetical protein
MVQRRSHPRFVQKLREELLFLGELRSQALQDGEPLEASETGLTSEKDLTHSPDCEAPDDRIFPEYQERLGHLSTAPPILERGQALVGLYS